MSMVKNAAKELTRRAMTNVKTETIAEMFDARAATYGRNEWHRRCAERLVELCNLSPGARVLDAATGTGFAALAAARIVGREGRVLGIDLSTGMLREARVAVRTSGLLNVQFLQADACQPPLDGSQAFDLVVCAAGLLYMNVAAALGEWCRLLKPGGLVAFSTMAAGSPPPGRIFRDCAARFGLALRDPSEALGTTARCRTALRDAGFDVAAVLSEIIEFSGQDLALAWDSNVRSAGHELVQSLSQPDRAALKKAYTEVLVRMERESPRALTQAEILYAFGRC
jgi:ubiquinone/menaquinone biosynthesis C-methylase UbiE